MFFFYFLLQANNEIYELMDQVGITLEQSPSEAQTSIEKISGSATGRGSVSVPEPSIQCASNHLVTTPSTSTSNVEPPRKKKKNHLNRIRMLN